jgi:excisionase family DNA binding protein
VTLFDRPNVGADDPANLTMPAPMLVSARDATRILGVGRTTIYELIRQGRIHPVHIGRCLRIPVVELERFVEGLRGPT